MSEIKPEIKYENTVPGIFIRRNNRFTAEVIVDDEQQTVHVKNTGRLGELLIPNAKVTLQRSDNPERTTGYDLISVYRPGFKWINVDSLVPNKLVRKYLEALYETVRPEYIYGDSRLDFYMERAGEKYLAEVKGCTLAFDRKTETGYFPDAPTERGIKHLKELTKAAKEGYHASVHFVIQMNGIHTVLPNDKTQPEFGRALAKAARAGVEVVYHSCNVEADSIKLTRTTINTDSIKLTRTTVDTDRHRNS